MVSSLEKVATIDIGRGTAVDPSGNVYAMGYRATATGGGLHALFKVAPGGAVSSTLVPVVIAGPIASDASGNIYVSDSEFCHGSSGCAIGDAPVHKVAPDGTVTSIPVTGSSNGSQTGVYTVNGLAVDARGNVDISHDGYLASLSPTGDLVLIAGASVPSAQEVDGQGAMARFAGPGGLAYDAAGNLYVADGNTIRKVAPDGTVTTIAGRPFVAGTADGAGSLATFNFPYALAVDPSGVIYVADSSDVDFGETGNALIRRIDPQGNVTTIAGTRGVVGFTPGPLPGVLDPPTGLALFGRDLYFTMQDSVGVVRNVP
jgi:hypothetical protein